MMKVIKCIGGTTLILAGILFLVVIFLYIRFVFTKDLPVEFTVSTQLVHRIVAVLIRFFILSTLVFLNIVILRLGYKLIPKRSKKESSSSSEDTIYFT